MAGTPSWLVARGLPARPVSAPPLLVEPIPHPQPDSHTAPLPVQDVSARPASASPLLIRCISNPPLPPRPDPEPNQHLPLSRLMQKADPGLIQKLALKLRRGGLQL